MCSSIDINLNKDEKTAVVIVKPSSLKLLCKVALPQAIIQCHRLEQFEKG